jgi:glycosyltransferase involved in cell wall biosynthesis
MVYSQIRVDLWRRLRFLSESAKKSEARNILYLYHQIDSSTFRYRVYNVCQALEASDVARAHFFYMTELHELVPYWRHVDAVVFARTPWTPDVENLTVLLKGMGKAVYFDVDDLVFDSRYIPLVMNTLSSAMDEADLNYWFSYVGRIDKTASLCDGFLTTNAHLARKLEEKYMKRTRIVPNTLNSEQAQISARLVDGVRPRNAFRIGYFSGSPSHNNDFYGIAHELGEFLNRNNDAQLSIVGFLDVPVPLEPFVREGRVINEPLMDYLDLQKAVWATDVNIVPLVVNDFTNCKSALKYFEAAIVGVPTIASPVHAYLAAIQHGENGLLCNQGEWKSALEQVRASSQFDPRALVEDARSRYLNLNKQGDIEDTFLHL